MKTIKFFAAALAIVAAASCAEKIDDNTGVEDATPELVEVSFQATIDSPSDPTKTTLAEDGVSVHWTEGDKILVYKPWLSYYYNNNKSTLKASSISMSSAVFEGGIIYSETYDAIYPVEAANQTKSHSDYNFFVDNTLANQTVRPNNFSVTNWGVSNIAMVSGVANGEKMNFKNIMAHFKFSIATEGVRKIEIGASKAADITSDNSQSTWVNLGGTIAIRFSTGVFGLYSDIPITVTNNGSDFVVGETYYVAIPALEMTELTFTLKDASNAAIKTLTKSSFKPVANTIYNLGAIGVSSGGGATQETTLSVSSNYLTVNAKNGSVNFTLNTNTNWTISSDKDWLSFSETSGDSATDKQITVTATNNTEHISRYANITVTAGDKKTTIYLTQSAASQVYKLGNKVLPSEMVSGGKYVIQLLADESLYWTNDNNKLVLSKLTDNEIHKENVMTFVYQADSDSKFFDGSTPKYKSMIVGTIKATTYSLDESLKFSQSASMWLTFGAQWYTDSNIGTRYDVDIYKNGTENFVYGSDEDKSVNCGSTGFSSNNHRKWYIYEVSE